MTGGLKVGLVTMSILMALASGLLYLMSIQEDSAPYTRGIDTVQKIQKLDTNWSLEAVKVKSNPEADFDALAAFIPEMNQLKSTLNEVILTSPSISDRFANSAAAFSSTLDAKEEQIERFKSGYAIVRNSERYLPLAANTVAEIARSEGAISFVEEISRVVGHINNYLRSPTDIEKTRIGLVLEELAAGKQSWTPKFSSAMGNFLSHAQVLLESTLPTTTLFEAATSTKASAAADQLITGFSAMASDVEQKKQKFQFGAMGALALMALLGMGAGLVRAPSSSGGSRRDYKNVPAESDAEVDVPGADNTSILPYRIFAGIISEDLVRAVSGIKADTELLKSVSHEFDKTLKHIQHTIGNIERGIVSQEKGLTVLKNDFDSSNDLIKHENFDSMIAGIEQNHAQLISLAQRLIKFSGKGDKSDHDWVSVNDVVREMVLPHSYNNEAKIDVRLGNVPHLYASPNEIKYLFKLIVDYSFTAIRSIDREEASIRVQTQLMDGQVCVTVTDNGVGMAPEKREALTHLFKPGDDGAVDLGFPSVGFIVKRYGGKLLLNSVPGKGTAIRVMLPEVQEQAA